MSCGEDLLSLPTYLLLIRRRQQTPRSKRTLSIYISNKIKLYPWAIGQSQDTRLQLSRGKTESRSFLRRFRVRHQTSFNSSQIESSNLRKYIAHEESQSFIEAGYCNNFGHY